jgi:hypothetical protein
LVKLRRLEVPENLTEEVKLTYNDCTNCVKTNLGRPE